ncbi:MAG: T9SS type A sorting domain-containing protein [Taibaiella sp.]|nr:T9SS type A sorting domain-containing protein [Taibaiella sp.]
MNRNYSIFFFALFTLSVSAHAQSRRIVTYAGSGGTGGFSGDGFAATGALFYGPQSVSVDTTGNVFVVDYYNARVRKIKKTGTIVTFAGTGVGGYSGDGTASTSAKVDPQGVAADKRGNVFISNYLNDVIRKVNPLGIISTYGGTGTRGYSGDNGPATAAKFHSPSGLFTDSKNNLYVADAGNNVIRKIDTFGTVTTVAGIGTAGYSGDGGAATAAELDSPYAVTMDRYGNLFIADYKNNVVRMVDPATGFISTFAGTGAYGYSGDGGAAAAAELNKPAGIAVDTNGNVFISDSYNNVIRVVNSIGIISTSVGNGTPGFGGDLGDPLGANLFHPYGIAIDTTGSMFIADANNQRIRKVYYTTLGVEDIDPNVHITAYPNPAGNIITVTNVAKNDKIVLSDIAGKVLSSTIAADNGDQTIATNTYAKGVYLLQVNGSNGAKKGTIEFVK